ncbi:MAG TPA: glycosyltransferase [Thermoplasmata archaeon]|nr:glycosyltransferase [Thermoplasmata archaeon]
MSGEVSVIVPTLNAARRLGPALASVAAEGPPVREVLVVDGGSRDATVELARRSGATVVHESRPLLAARVTGILRAVGEFSLLLDADQRIVPGSIGRALRRAPEVDMLCLSERAEHRSTWTQRLLDDSKRIVQSNPTEFLTPFSGLFMPRWFRTDQLKTAAGQIPAQALEVVTDRDHQILYYEVWKRHPRVAVVDDALVHDEPATLSELMAKSFRWGVGAGHLRATHLYDELLRRPALAGRRPERGHGGGRDLRRAESRANLSVAIKSVPYGVGYLLGRVGVPLP